MSKEEKVIPTIPVPERGGVREIRRRMFPDYPFTHPRV